MPETFTARSTSIKIRDKSQQLDVTQKASEIKKTYSQERREEQAKYDEAKKLAEELEPTLPE
jgi:hypothetical protein